MSESDWHKAADGVKTLLDAVFPAIAVSGIDPIVADSIVIRKRPVLFAGITLPAIILAPMDELERVATVSQNDTGHGIGVVIVQTGNREATTDSDQLQYWRGLAKATLLNQRINSAGVYRIDLEPRTVLDAAAWGAMYDVTSFVARAWIRN